MKVDTHSLTLLGPGTCPPEIDRALKEIDPNAELLHLGGSRWWLGIKAPNPEASRDDGVLGHAKRHAKRPTSPQLDPAEKAVMQVELEKEFTMRQIMASGFRPVALYEVEGGGAPGWDIVEDFRIRDYNFRTKTEDQIRRDLKKHMSIEERDRPRIERFGRLAKEKASEVWRYALRRARSVLVGANLE